MVEYKIQLRLALAASVAIFSSAFAPLASASPCGQLVDLSFPNTVEPSPQVRSILAMVGRSVFTFGRVVVRQERRQGQYVRGASANAVVVKCGYSHTLLILSRQIGDLAKDPTNGHVFWRLAYIVSHEYGHILRNHARMRCPKNVNHREGYGCTCETKKGGRNIRGVRWNKQREYEADYIAGAILRRMGAQRNQLLNAVTKVVTRFSLCTHPDIGSRKEKALSGYLSGSFDRGARTRIAAMSSAEFSKKFVAKSGVDIFGNDFYPKDNVDMLQCASHCIGLPGNSCVGFTYDRWFRKCYPKSRQSLLNVIGHVSLWKIESALRVSADTTSAIRSEILGVGASFPKPSTDDKMACVNYRTVDRVFPVDRTEIVKSAAAGGEKICAWSCVRDDKCVAYNFFGGRCQFLAGEVPVYQYLAGAKAGYIVWQKAQAAEKIPSNCSRLR